MKVQEFKLATPQEGMIDITAQVRQMLCDSGIYTGLCTVFCPHTTAAITTNENADPDVVSDFLLGLGKAYPDRPEFNHCEGNSAAHLKSSAIGCSQTFIIEEGRLMLGTWQGIYFCEFDGPRSRRFLVKIMDGNK
ncbi:MAG: secondary thiamine-phosphate synthase enzyme YjbQ [Oscillospiraceae bacterium]|nr:secondary thiamine-phosphate synthase enzyme YjbQ [Oscillospiraceae bacterium]